jgi:hypothetical protein
LLTNLLAAANLPAHTTFKLSNVPQTLKPASGGDASFPGAGSVVGTRGDVCFLNRVQYRGFSAKL